MPLSAGDKLGPYEILAAIGKGGMGEVFRAHDPRTGRDVAIKISAEQFSERFDREVRAVAALNHPNICHLYDVGPNYLVMELIEGESPQGPMPLDEALKIAKQIAEALSAAHEKGIIHRDLKPGNIKVKPDGTVKVLDFGLAKVAPASAGVPQSENSPTLSMAATQAGVILGTAAYMAPEQAKGKPVDKRADIWAFGVVLHELLTGHRLFQHDDLTETLAAVVLSTPNLDGVPFEVRRLLKKCLEKDPKKRLRDIGDVWELLEKEPPAPLAAPSESQVVKRSRFGMAGWVAAAVLLLALAASLAWIFNPPPPLAITRFPFTLGEGQAFTNTGRSYLAISPDGTQMVYVADGRLYLRSMAELEARPIPGTDLGAGVTNPVFSPDGKSLAFFANSDRTIKRISVSGGAAVTICAAGNPTGMNWSEEGIVFAQGGKGILRVSPNGGQPEPLVTAKSDEQMEGPQMLPGGKAVLFTLAASESLQTAAWDKAQIVVQTLKSGARKVVLEGGADARYLPTGHLVYALNGVLFALPFNLRGMETAGGPVGIVEGVARAGSGAAQFAFSSNGSLIYVPGPIGSSEAGRSVLGLVDRNLGLVDRNGAIEPLKVPPGAYAFPRVSRDGRRVAYQLDDGKESSIWIYELSGATAPRRLTLPGTGANRDPIWSSDNERVAFQSDREGDLGIWWQRADGNGTAERLTKPDQGISHIPDSWSPDGQFFSFTEAKNSTSAVWTYSLRDKKATLFAETPGARLERSVFSPDGRWIAYQIRASANSANSRIYVRPFPPTATAYETPPDADNHHPLWSPDGKELFYVPGPGLFGSVRVSTQPSVSFGPPVRMPKLGFLGSAPSSVRNFDFLPDGQHFIGVVQAGQPQAGQAQAGQAQAAGTPSAPQIQVVLNWFEDVKQRAPGK
jgi:serine/threonine protein kinase/Tol biopolymer transport system component